MRNPRRYKTSSVTTVLRTPALGAYLVFVVVACLQAKVGVAAVPKAAAKSPATPRLTIEESRLWRENPLLQKIAKKLNPLAIPPGDGALGLNRRFPEKVLVEYQIEGWNWIRAGAALGNGFIADRGVMAFEWAFARMGDSEKPAGTDDAAEKTAPTAEPGSFGESKTIEVTHFLGLYARSVLLLRGARLEERAKRLERLSPRLETSLRSEISLFGERRWNRAEKKSNMTHQRIQAAAAAFWIGRLLSNPALRKTADLWLDEALNRQDLNGLFPSGLPAKSKAAGRAQLEALEALQGLAWADAGYALKLREPIARGFRGFEMTKTPMAGSPITVATYAAWTKNPAAIKLAQNAVKGAPKPSLFPPASFR